MVPILAGIKEEEQLHGYK